MMWWIAPLICALLAGAATGSIAAGVAVLLAFGIFDAMIDEACERIEKAIQSLGEIEDEEEG